MTWAWVDELKQRWRMATGTMKAADYEAVIEKTAADMEAAMAKLQAARERLDREYFDLHMKEDQVAIARLRKAVREAQEKVHELEDAAARLKQKRDAAAAAEFAANTEARWRAAEQLAQRWQFEGEAIGVSLATLVEQAQAFANTGRELHQLLSGEESKSSLLSDDVRSATGLVLWNPGRLAREIDLQLWALSDGLLAPRSGGVGAGTPYQLRCGPDFKRRVHESIALAFKARGPRSATPEPPEAA